MRKWMIKFLKIYQFAVIYFNFVRFGVRCDLRRFSVLSPFLEKSMVYCIIIIIIIKKSQQCKAGRE